MQLTRRAEYAIRAMLDLALHQRDDQPIMSKDIAEREEIPYEETAAGSASINARIK